ncbi:MAG: hypothetical protein ACRCVA_35745 [Phreatobacter sp.]
MQMQLIALLTFHVLASVFWAGSTFTLARLGGAGAEALFRPQMGAAVVVFLTGIGLWMLVHTGSHGLSEQLLTVGAVAALAAAGVQGGLRRKPALAHRIAAGLLMVTAVTMAAARYAG